MPQAQSLLRNTAEMPRDHVAIAKKAARTRAKMRLAQAYDPEAKAKYDAKRRLEEVQRAAHELIADRAGYASKEFQSAVREPTLRRAAPGLGGALPARQSRLGGTNRQ